MAALALPGIVTGVVTLSGGQVAHASSITVNTDADPSPNSQGRWPDDGLCSLRAAMTNAMGNGQFDPDCQPGASGVLDTVQIAPSLAGSTVTLAHATALGVQSLPLVSGPDNPLKIVGPTLDAADFVISGGDKVRPIVTGFVNLSEAAGVLTLANLTVTGGNGANNGAPAIPDAGGAFFLGEGSRLTLDNVVVRGNRINARGARGGAIYALNSTIINNGGAYIDNSVTGDGTSEGGALYLEQSSGAVGSDAVFEGYAMLMAGNTAEERGGAITMNAAGVNGRVVIDRSLFRDNSAGFGGVLFAIAGINGNTGFTVTDSTFTRNSSVIGGHSGTTLHFVHDTFVDTGLIYETRMAGSIANSIITGGTGCAGLGPGGVRNLITPVPAPNNCAIQLNFGVPDNVLDSIGEPTGVASELAQNGGPDVQQTFALSSDSNAIDNGHPDWCTERDARSVPRGINAAGDVDWPQLGDCDIGAYEYADNLVNFTTGTSAAAENAGQVIVQVRLRIMTPGVTELAQPLKVPVTVDPELSTAAAGPAGDFSLDSPFAEFPGGSVDGALATVSLTLHDDQFAELQGEELVLRLGEVPRVERVEPATHVVSITDDDVAGITVDDRDGLLVDEADPARFDVFTLRLNTPPDRVLIDPTRPGDPASYGPPADVDVWIRPTDDCTVQVGTTVGTAGSPLVFTITNATWSIQREIGVRAVDDLYDEDLQDESVPHTCELDIRTESGDPLYAVAANALTVDVLDDDVAGITLVGGFVPELAEGSGSAPGWVRLDTPPEHGAVSLAITASPGCEVGSESAGFADEVTHVFLEADFAQARAVDVRAGDDLVVDLWRTCSFVTRITTVDPVYASLPALPAPAGFDVIDYDPSRQIFDDPPFVLVETPGVMGASGVIAAEGGSDGTVEVRLARAPARGSVRVDLRVADDVDAGGRQLALGAGGDVAEVVSLVFTPDDWDIPRHVTVIALDDDVDEADPHTSTLTVSVTSDAPGFDDPGLRAIDVDGVLVDGDAVVQVTIADDDSAGVLMALEGGGVSVAEGRDATLLMSLSSRPSDVVEVELRAPPDCTLAEDVVVVPPDRWNAPVPIILTAVDDVDEEGDGTECSITATTRSADPSFVGLQAVLTVEVLDDEQPAVSISTSGGVTVAEDGATSDTFDVVLLSRPADDVVLVLAGDDQTALPTEPLRFTPDNWSIPQTVTVTAVDDDFDEEDVHDSSIALAVASGAVGFSDAALIVVDADPSTTLTVAVSDNDTAGIVTPADGTEVDEQAFPTSYPVALASRPTAPVTATITASGQCTVEPAQIGFAAAGWDQPVEVTVTPIDDRIPDGPSQCRVRFVAASDDPSFAGLTAAWVLIVLDDDRPVVAEDDNASAVEDAGAVVIDVLANDVGDQLTIVSSDPPARGTVVCTRSSCSYTPARDFNGTDHFTYVASDGITSDSAIVTVTVSPVLDVPTLAPETVHTTPGSSVTFGLLDGLSNPDRLDVSVTVGSPQHGTVVCSADWQCQYTPTPGFVGTDSVTFVVDPGLGVAALITGSITFVVDAAPGAGSAGGGTTGGTSSGGSASAGGTDDPAGSAAGDSDRRPPVSRLPDTGRPVGDLLDPAALVLVAGLLLLTASRRRSLPGGGADLAQGVAEGDA